MADPRRFRDVRPGPERIIGPKQARHHHRAGYANVVLAGHFSEASFAGLMRAGPGDVLLHGAFDSHCNDGLRSSRPLILRLPSCGVGLEGLHRVADPEELVRLAARDPRDAVRRLGEVLQAVPSGGEDWPERLAGDLNADPSLPLRDWAQRTGLAAETLSRGFRQVFGVSPKRFRMETRARQAWRELVRSKRPLTEIAHDSGFADLAHMSRSVAALTGAPPRSWRSSLNSVQATSDALA